MVGKRTARDQVPTDAEEAEYGEAPDRGMPEDQLASVAAEGHAMGHDHEGGEEEPDQVQTIRSRIKSVAEGLVDT